MKILFSSYAFRPSVGGIETVSAILAEEFVAAGHEVLLMTQTPGDDGEESYPIVRQPSLKRMIDLIRWSDLLFQNNISLRSLLPALLLRKPALVVHQTWLQNVRGEIAWNDRVKRALLPLVNNVAISQAIADRLNTATTVIGNPYDDYVFRLLPQITRDKTIVFLGRLVSDKGVDLLLRALKLLQDEQYTPDLTIIGTGPEEENLKCLARDLGLAQQVTFAGQQSGVPLAELLSRHRFLVVPSRWAEPFGVVALEGIACGCVVVGSEKGGLNEAMGPCGVTFENANERSLGEALRRLLVDSTLEATLRSAGPAHLERFKRQTIGRAYLNLMDQLVR